jgi:hypothetical protein
MIELIRQAFLNGKQYFPGRKMMLSRKSIASNTKAQSVLPSVYGAWRFDLGEEAARPAETAAGQACVWRYGVAG